MAEIVVNLIGRLAYMLAQKTFQEAALVTSFRDDLDFMFRELNSIKCLLIDAHGVTHSSSMNNWLQNLQDFFEDAIDLIENTSQQHNSTISLCLLGRKIRLWKVGCKIRLWRKGKRIDWFSEFKGYDFNTDSRKLFFMKAIHKDEIESFRGPEENSRRHCRQVLRIAINFEDSSKIHGKRQTKSQ
ncbi:hypothetical protein SUGI_0796970 [Cryptomeria japonica]|nr:hypothetical protein SUGI_0796970 [Cryptomeria japonica]